MHDDEIRALLCGDYPRVVQVVTAVCGDRHRAEDAVQDAIIDVWRTEGSVENLTAWVTTAAINRSRSRWRSLAAEGRAFARMQLRASASSDEPGEPFDAGLASALRGLPHAQRSVVALHYLLDMSVADVARYLGIAEGTVKAQLHRGRESLRTAMKCPAQPKEAHRVRR